VYSTEDMNTNTQCVKESNKHDIQTTVKIISNSRMSKKWSIAVTQTHSVNSHNYTCTQPGPLEVVHHITSVAMTG